MLYCSWDMVRDRCNCYFSFWAIFCPFTPLTAQKIKILKKWKKCLEISSFYISVPKIMIRWCTVPEIWCMTDIWLLFLILGYFLPFYPPPPPLLTDLSEKFNKFTSKYDKVYSELQQWKNFNSHLLTRSFHWSITLLLILNKIEER